MSWPAILVLLAACVHEFSWRALPFAAQGQWWAMTQWLPIVTIGYAAVFAQKTRSLKAAVLAAVIMSSTTSLCSVYWLAIARFDTVPGEVQCSTLIGFPIELLSVLAALAVLARSRND